MCVEQAMLLSLFRFLLGERPAEPRRDDRRDCLPDDKVLNDPRGHGRLLLCSLVLGTVDRPHRCVLLVIGTPRCFACVLKKDTEN